MIAKILHGRAMTRLLAVLSLAVPLASLADFQKTNPVTGETENYTWKFVGTSIWNGTQYWQNSSGANPSAVPAKTGDNVWDPILFDGNTININASMKVEGWNLRMGLYNGANITLNHLIKFQGGIVPRWITVDASSQLKIAGFNTAQGNINNITRFYVAKENGITWTTDFAMSNGSSDSGHVAEYYFTGDGSVSYQGISASSHKIKMADVTLVGGEKEVKSKTLVSFTSTSRTFSADATIKVKKSNGDLIDTVSLTSIASDATTLTTDRAVGACELVSTSTGILLYYVDGEPEGPTVVGDGGVYEISAPLVDAVQIACDGSFTITGTDSYTASETDLAQLNLDAVTGTVTLGAYTCYALDSSRTLPAAYTFGEGSAVEIAETAVEYGTGVFAVSGLWGVSTVVLSRRDGTTEEIAVTEGAASLKSPVHVSGIATWVDYEMNGNNANSGAEGTVLHYDTGYNAENSFYNGETLYTYSHPYRDNLAAYPANWTAVVRCTVPNLANAAIITFGNRDAGLLGLIAGDDPETQMKLVQTTGNSAYETKATMDVLDATSAQHVYVFAVENNQTLKCWCDGSVVLNETLDSPVSIGSGFQIGSVVYGAGNTGIVRWWPGSAAFDSLTPAVQAAAQIDCLRLYDYILSDEQIAELSEEFPSVKLYRATAAEDADTSWTDLTWAPDWDGGNNQSKVILTTEGDASVALPETITADEVELLLATDSTLTLSGPGSLTVTKPITVGNGTLVLTGTVTLTRDTAFNGAVSFSQFTKAGDGAIQLASGATVGVDAALVVTPLGSYTCAEGTVADSAYTGEGVKLIPLTSAVVSITQNGTTLYYSDLDTGVGTLNVIGDVSDDVRVELLNGTTWPTTPYDYAGILRTMGYYIDGDGILTKAVARITSTPYQTLAAAVEAATDGATVTLLLASSEAITLSDKAITIEETANFSGTLTGNGTLTFKAFRNNPSITFTDWTGAVVLPEFAADGTILNKYGATGSTVVLNGITGGWLGETASQTMTVAPALQLDGNVTITGFSTAWTYTFAEITGTGTLALTPADNNPLAVNITKVAEGFTGTINNGTDKTIAIATLARASGTSTAADTKLLATSGSFETSALTVGGESVDVPLVTKNDGIYIDAVASVTAGESTTRYATLAAAVAGAADGATVTLLGNLTLEARVEPNLGAGTTLTIDLGGYTLTREGTSGNGSAFDVKSGTVTIKNGTIDCTQDDAAIVADGVYAITSRGTAAVTLEDLDVTVDSQAGACAYPLGSSTITIKSGTYANTTTDEYQYHAGWTGMAVNQPNVATQQLFIEGGTFSKVNPELGDDSGKMANFCAAGYISVDNGDGTYTVKAGSWVAEVGGKTYETLAAAVAAAQDGDTVALLANVTLAARVEPNLGAGTTLTIDLGGYTLTREGTSGNGSVFDVKSGTVTIKNGTIDCTQDDTAIVADGVYAITSRSGSTVYLETLTVTVDSECGACVYPFSGSTMTIRSGFYANTTETPYRYKTAWTGMAVNQANESTQALFLEGGSFKQVDPKLGDDSGEMTNFCADGKTTELQNGWYVVVDDVQTVFDGGDSTFTIDNQDSITLPAGKALADTASAASGLTYAQAWVLGLLDNTGALTADLAATIEVTGDEVVVKINGEPKDGYLVTLKVFEKATLAEEWPAVPTKTYSFANATTTDAKFTAGDAGFYKVDVTISNATQVSP